jgi:cob(I)alamin adenosyltransferase
MSWLSTLRSKWRQHDEQLAERAYRDGDAIEKLEEHEHVMDAGLLGSGSAANLVAGRTVAREVERALQTEDALEHEEPK